MAKLTSLPKDMWEAARVIWENTPSMTDRELLERLRELYGDNAPNTHTTVGRKRKSQNWTRKSILDTKNAPKNAPNIQKKRTKNAPKRPAKKTESFDNSSENNKEKENALDAPNEKENALENAPDDAPKSTAVTVFKEAEERIYATAEKLVLDTQDKARIIQKHRKRIKLIGEMQDTVLDTINIIDGMDLEDSESGEKISKVLIVADTSSRVLNNLVASQKTIFEQEMTICGIKMTDFEMSEQDRRMQGMEKLVGIADEEAQARQQLQASLKERLERFRTLEIDELAAQSEVSFEDDLEDEDFEEEEED